MKVKPPLQLQDPGYTGSWAGRTFQMSHGYIWNKRSPGVGYGHLSHPFFVFNRALQLTFRRPPSEGAPICF